MDKFHLPIQNILFYDCTHRVLAKSIKIYLIHVSDFFLSRGKNSIFSQKWQFCLLLLTFNTSLLHCFFLQVYTYFILKLSSWPKESENTQFTADLYPKNKIIALWKIALFTPFFVTLTSNPQKSTDFSALKTCLLIIIAYLALTPARAKAQFRNQPTLIPGELAENVPGVT